MQETPPAPPTTSEVEVKPGKPTAKTIDKGLFTLEEFVFSGDYDGWKLWVKQYKSLSSASEHLTQLIGKEKADELIGVLVNRALGFGMKTKAKNRVAAMTKEERDFAEEQGDTVLIDEKGAEEFVPGERDITSIAGLRKLLSELSEQVKAAKTAGDLERVKTLAVELKETYAMLEKAVADDQKKVLASLGIES